MLELAWSVLQTIGKNGKTATGAVLFLVGQILGTLNPDDVALIQALIAGTNAAGSAFAVVGLAHKIIKAVQAQREKAVSL